MTPYLHLILIMFYDLHHLQRFWSATSYMPLTVVKYKNKNMNTTSENFFRIFLKKFLLAKLILTKLHWEAFKPFSLLTHHSSDAFVAKIWKFNYEFYIFWLITTTSTSFRSKGDLQNYYRSVNCLNPNLWTQITQCISNNISSRNVEQKKHFQH